ncbi:MAG TPA: NAD-dependent epimerase/dehydratase family protein [Myxococcaceae bacterium]|nr:NAD-dependent epimerase/dehydratase family protein [Myxococcaceae bacterium]
MRVFLTGATGYIGSAVVQAFRKAGHEVTGLVRSAQKEATLKAAGARAIRGSIQEPATYENVAREHDALIHAAFDYSSDGVAADRTVIETLLSAARGASTPRVLLYASGVWVLGNTGSSPATESASTERAPPVMAWRPGHERKVLQAASGNLLTAVIRAGMVYGDKGGLVSPEFERAAKEGAASYAGAGENHWSLVHREDLGRLYVLVAERRGSGIFHGVDGHPLRVAEIAKAISEAAGQGGKTRSIAIEEARRQLGPVADALCLDQLVIAPRSTELGWKPAYRDFLSSVQAAYREWIS